MHINLRRLLKITRPNNGMHPTADTPLLIFGNLLGRQVMPGVRYRLGCQAAFTIKGSNGLPDLSTP